MIYHLSLCKHVHHTIEKLLSDLPSGGHVILVPEKKINNRT